MSCTYEEALQIEEDFLVFAQQVKAKNAASGSIKASKSGVPKLPGNYKPPAVVRINLDF